MKILKIGSTDSAKITLVKNVDDVRRYVNNSTHSFSDNQGIGDLSLLSGAAISALLKFIEEGIDTIICYASRDNISPVLMSRFDIIELHTDINISTGYFPDYVDHCLDSDNADNVKEREYVAKCGNCIDQYLLFKRLPYSIKTRVGRFL
jgi:hypothetical protein